MGYAVKLQSKEVLYDTEPMMWSFEEPYYSQDNRLSAFIIRCKGYSKVAVMQVQYNDSVRKLDVYTATHNVELCQNYTTPTKYPYSSETFLGTIGGYKTWEETNIKGYEYILLRRNSAKRGTLANGYYMLKV